MPITIKKTINIKLGKNSFIGNKIVGKDKEVEKAKKDTETVIVKTKTQVRRSTKV